MKLKAIPPLHDSSMGRQMRSRGRINCSFWASLGTEIDAEKMEQDNPFEGSYLW
jgi:hypothetical protein